LATHTAQRIREAQLSEKPRVLVIDFFRGTVGTSSRSGTLLAEHFSESLSNFSQELTVLDRQLLKDYLRKEWITLGNLHSNEASLQLGRDLGATGVITGSVFEENGRIILRIHTEGLGSSNKKAATLNGSDEYVRLTATQEMKDLLFQEGPNYARTPDQIPEEPGILKAGIAGVGIPTCTYCPSPSYSDAGRAAKFQGVVVLSLIVTREGMADSIYVLRGAPFGLTATAITAVHSWKFKPAQKDGKPISVRVPIEVTFRLF
jgi:TonB family protein